MATKKEEHEHDYKEVGRDGAGRQILQCSCGSTITGI